MKKKELQVLVEKLTKRVDQLEQRHLKILGYFLATKHPHIDKIDNQLNDTPTD